MQPCLPGPWCEEKMQTPGILRIPWLAVTLITVGMALIIIIIIIIVASSRLWHREVRSGPTLGWASESLGFLGNVSQEWGAPVPELWPALLTGLACQQGTNTLTLGGGQGDWPLAARCPG